MKSLRIVSIGLVFVAAFVGCTGDAFTSGDPPDLRDSGNATEGSVETSNDASTPETTPEGDSSVADSGTPETSSEADTGVADSGTPETTPGVDTGVADTGTPDASCFVEPTDPVEVSCDQCLSNPTSGCPYSIAKCKDRCDCAKAYDDFLSCITHGGADGGPDPTDVCAPIILPYFEDAGITCYSPNCQSACS